VHHPKWLSFLQQHNYARYHDRSADTAVRNDHIHYYRLHRRGEAAEDDNLQRALSSMTMFVDQIGKLRIALVG
jgi:hypothetical protein